MYSNIAIVIATYNRPKSLERLLGSLSNANYPENQIIHLIISIDYSDDKATFEVANNFSWNKGNKQIISHTEKQGLKKHIIFCGDISKNYDAIVLLEDDLLVSPAFYFYAQSAIDFYTKDEKIAGISLYAYRYNEAAACSFEPFNDQYDNYFIQFPSSWGQVWTKNQWYEFKSFFNSNLESSNIQLPNRIQNWPSNTSWKKSFVKYLIYSDKYFVFPRVSLTTNFGDKGEHYQIETSGLQVPLLVSRKSYHFSNFSESDCVYDCFFELKLIHPERFGLPLDICFDLNATKNVADIKSEYILTSRKVKHAIQKFQTNLYPYELNIIFLQYTNSDKNIFALAKTNDVLIENNFNRIKADISRNYFSKEGFNDIQLGLLKRTDEYRIGSFLIRMFPFIKKLVKRS